MLCILAEFCIHLPDVAAIKNDVLTCQLDVLLLQEAACGCAGIYSAPVALALYAAAFEEHNALEHFEAFASHSGADFYGLPRNTGKLTLQRQLTRVPELINPGKLELVPFQAGLEIPWTVQTL